MESEIQMSGRDIASDLIKGIFDDYIKESRPEFMPENSDDPLIRLLNYYRICADVIQRKGHLPRTTYDADARYYFTLEGHTAYGNKKRALRGDIMVSFWTPYNAALMEKGLTPPDPDKKSFGKCFEDIDFLIANAEEDGFREVNRGFRLFAEVYHSPGNFLFLPPPDPDGRMNNVRYSCSKDKIDETLYHCFSGSDRKLAKYFGTDKALYDWIREQNLNSGLLFKNKEVARDKIICLSGHGDIHLGYPEMAKRGLLGTFIENVIKLINERNGE